VVRKARYVDSSKCTGCGVCLEKCPTRYAPRFKTRKTEVTLSDDERRLMTELIERHGKSRTPVMRILQETNARLRYLPENVLRYLSLEFAVPVSVLYRIATFYTAFSLTPRGEHLVSVCTGTACHIKGAARLVDELQRELDIAVGGTTRDLRFSLETVRCLGCCSLAPVVKVGERVYGGVKPGEISRILKEYRV
jgi:NADP-reducing hydrogenase subunit HndA